jgi:hypothetical protein
MTAQHIFHPGGNSTITPGGRITHWAPQGGGGGESGLNALFSQPGQFANAYANTYGSYAGGMGSVAGALGQIGGALGSQFKGLSGAGDAIANNFGHFGGAQAAFANAQANERAAAFGAMSQAEAARQLAAGNIANQKLAAYGGMGNSAMAAWAQNQSSYNQALQNMSAANQMAVSQLGQSQNQALSGLGDSTARLGRGLAAAGAIGNIDFGMGGGGQGFEVTGPNGMVASGSFGGDPGAGGSRGGGAPELSNISDRSFGALDTLRSDVMNPSFLDNLENSRRDGFDRLDAQHYSSRNAPFDMLRSSVDDLQQLSSPGYSALRQGMDQFYGNVNANRADFSEYPRALERAFNTSSQDLRDHGGQLIQEYRTGLGPVADVLSELRNVRGGLGGGMTTTQGQIKDLFKNSLGKMPVFQSPLQRQQDLWAVQDATRARAEAMRSPRR